MSYALRISLTFNPLRQTKPLCFSRDRNGFYHHFSNLAAIRTAFLVTNRCVRRSRNTHVIDGCIKASTRQSEEGPVLGNDLSPVSAELEPISSETQFDRVLAQAQQLQESVVIVWMASWCRKCVYLKPKLEKLAADYYPRIRFYCVDVNNVPHKLVVRAGVTKMPTIQLWKDSKKQAEIIGGHKAYLVANEVREMIENEFTV